MIIKIFSFSPSCINHSKFCNHCDILTNLCYRCEIPEILVPDENGGCIGNKKCILGKNNCYECDTDGKLCKKCEINYYPDENGGCAYTEGCEISYMGECIKCKTGFILIGSESLKICKSLDIDNYRNCKNIDLQTGYCTECERGYYLTSIDHKCIKTQYCKESIS